jgi:flagellar M-ring protein FliF
MVDPQLPVWRDPQIIQLGFEGGKYLGLGLLILFVYFAIIRPLLRTVAPPSKHDEPGLKAGRKGRKGEAEDGEDEGEGALAGEDVNVELSAVALRSNEFGVRLERARELARENPKAVAELLNQWLGANEEGGHK